MITVQAFREPEKQPGTVPEEYRADQKAEEGNKSARGPLGILGVLAAIALYLSSFLPAGRAEEAPEDGATPVHPENSQHAMAKEETAAGAQQDTSENQRPDNDNSSEEPEPDDDTIHTSSFIPQFDPADWAGLEFSSAGRVALGTQLGPLGSGSPQNDNIRPIAPTFNTAGSNSGGGGEGSGVGIDDGRTDPGNDGVFNPPVLPPDPEPDLPGPAANRAPRINGPLRLQDMIGFHGYFISVSVLLAGATDADGDPLTIAGIEASRGTLTPVQGGWTFDGVPGILGDVTFSYAISDGAASIQQVAYMMVLPPRIIIGTDRDDNILGTPFDDEIQGGAGDDNIDASAGDDVVSGGPGNDHIVGGDGDDVIFAGCGDDIVFGGRGNDIIFGGCGNDRLYGEDGNDIIFGEAGDDLIFGGHGNDELMGGEGNDQIWGGEGNDIIHGDEGNDTLYGEAGDDILFGGAGDDVIQGGAGNDIISDGAGQDFVDAGDGDDYVIAATGFEADQYFGGSGVDTLDYSGALSNLTINALEGTAFGADIGSDLFSGFEAIIGGAGDDHMIGGASLTELTGGAGNDTFEFRLPEGSKGSNVVGKITDFTIGDKLYIADFEVKYRDLEDFLDEIDDAFKLVYSPEDNERPIRIRFDKMEERDITVIEVRDVNGDGVEDTYSVQLDGKHSVGLTFTIV